jgi:hypothetical protein
MYSQTPLQTAAHTAATELFDVRVVLVSVMSTTSKFVEP